MNIYTRIQSIYWLTISRNKEYKSWVIRILAFQKKEGGRIRGLFILGHQVLYHDLAEWFGSIFFINWTIKK